MTKELRIFKAVYESIFRIECSIDDHNKEAITTCMQWALDPERTKAPFIFGEPGSGKSDLSKVLMHICNEVDKRKTWTWRNIPARIRLKEFINNSAMSVIVSDLEDLQNMSVFFDELGTQSEVTKEFGSSQDFGINIVLDRYNLSKYGVYTGFTTNFLNSDQIKERYDERILSRLKEMCFFVELAGKDRRKDERKSIVSSVVNDPELVDKSQLIERFMNKAKEGKAELTEFAYLYDNCVKDTPIEPSTTEKKAHFVAVKAGQKRTLYAFRDGIKDWETGKKLELQRFLDSSDESYDVNNQFDLSCFSLSKKNIILSLIKANKI